MKKIQKENTWIAILVFMLLAFAYALVVIIVQDTEIKELKQKSLSGCVFSTVQIWNEGSGRWDTYQGDLDFDSGLRGEWKYEVMGQPAILTGARFIGSVEPDGKTETEGPTAKEGKVEIYLDTGEKYTFYGTIVTPSVPLADEDDSDVVFYMPIAELQEFVNLLEGEFDYEK